MTEGHCANCGFKIEFPDNILESEEMTVIQQRVASQQVSRDNCCHNCQLVVTATLTPKQEPEESVNQYRCINCRLSVRRKRYHLLSNNTDRESNIRNVIMEWILPREISLLSRICHPCWQRAARAVARSVQEPASTSSASRSSAAMSLAATSSAATSSAATSSAANSSAATSSAATSSAATSSAETSSAAMSSATTKEAEIILPSYTRAAKTERRCFFPDCHRSERIQVPTSIRMRLLCDLSFYVPEKCRICNFHLRNHTWDSLIVENGNHTFTVPFIEDMLSFLKNPTGNNIDFENIEDSDDNLVYYWLGMSKDQFRRMLERVPQLSNSHRGATGLAAYLTKLQTGDSDHRLSELFKIPRTTLERLMRFAKELLPEDFEQLMD